MGALIRGRERMQYTKYMTKLKLYDDFKEDSMDLNEESEQKSNGDINGTEDVLQRLHHGHQFGVRYHYWNHTFNEDWDYFVDPKYPDLKREILNLSTSHSLNGQKNESISMQQWQIVY